MITRTGSGFDIYVTDITAKTTSQPAVTESNANFGYTPAIAGQFSVGADHGGHTPGLFTINYLGVTNTALTSADINGTSGTGVGGFALDPVKWISDNTITDPDDHKVWLMGDGALDLFPEIQNEVDTSNGSSRLDMKNMTAGSIINTTVPNL